MDLIEFTAGMPAWDPVFMGARAGQRALESGKSPQISWGSFMQRRCIVDAPRVAHRVGSLGWVGFGWVGSPNPMYVLQYTAVH